jgi:NAD(P)-dependent dehydrogenase (short-subunit alcohol dehydrogenase family)
VILEGKAAIVTGSSKGLGRAFATSLAAEGASVVVNGTNADDVEKVVGEIKKAGGKAVGCVESVATMAGAQRIIQTALDEFGHLDILVNNAGILRDRTFMKMTEQEWDEVIAVHLKGTFACSKAAAVPMSQQGSGRIINMTSRSAYQPPIGQANYAAAKGGIIGLTLNLALELSRYGITVNVVAPHALTRMTAPLKDRIMQQHKEEAERAGLPVPTALDLGLTDPEMCAPLVTFLASDEAKDITGAILDAGGERIGVLCRNERIASATMMGGWTVEALRSRFRILLARALSQR